MVASSVITKFVSVIAITLVLLCFAIIDRTQ